MAEVVEITRQSEDNSRSKVILIDSPTKMTSKRRSLEESQDLIFQQPKLVNQVSQDL